MSLTVTDKKSLRDELALNRRQAVYMFIATHLDADGTFKESDQFIANSIRGGNRDNVNYARQSLEASGDVMVVKNRRLEGLPNIVWPVPIRTFWVREWKRNGAKGAKPMVGTGASCANHKTGGDCPPSKSLNQQELNPTTDAAVPTTKHGERAQKNSTLYTGQPYSLSVEQLSTAYRAYCSAHPLDPPVQRALDSLRGKLTEIKTKLAQYHPQATGEMPERYRAEVSDIEAEIATLEGR
jgi:hypothetical protein